MREHVTNAFKNSLIDLSFKERVLEPESMEETAEDYAGMDFAESNKAFIDLMSPMIPENSQVVDFGCGPGDIAVILAKARPDLKITGVDISQSMLKIAEQKARGEGAGNKLSWQIGDITWPILAKGKIDFAYSHTTLHHLKKIMPFFYQVDRALRPQGGFCIRDLRRPRSAIEAIKWIYEATGNKLTQRQYELFFYSLRASLTLPEIRKELIGTVIQGKLEASKNPKRYWVLYKTALPQV